MRKTLHYYWLSINGENGGVNSIEIRELWRKVATTEYQKELSLNNVQVGRYTFKRLNCKGWKRGLEECRVFCELQMAKRHAHKRITQIKCATNNNQGQDYRFIQTTNRVTYNAENRNINDLSAMLLAMVTIVLAGLLLNYRGLWKLKCQIVGMLIMIGIPPSKGRLQWPRVEGRQEAKCPTGTEHYDAIMAGLICALIGAVIVCVCLGCELKTARKYKRVDGIYLQIVTERLSETAHLGECLMPIDQVFQGSKMEPLIRELCVKHICGTYIIQLVWGRPLYAIETVATGQAIDLMLPGSVNISKRMATALREDPLTIRMARLVRYTGGLASIVLVGMPMISAAGWSVIGGRKMKEQEFPELKPPTVVRSKSGRNVRSSHGSKRRNRESEEKACSRGIEETYDVPQTRSHICHIRPPSPRTSEYESITMTEITPSVKGVKNPQAEKQYYWREARC